MQFDQLNRRDFITLLGGAAAAWPLAARAQQPAAKLPRIGFLGNSTAELETNLAGPFRDGLRALGYEEGRNIAIEYRWAEGKYERFAALIAELVASKCRCDRDRGHARLASGQEGDNVNSTCHDCRRRAGGDGPRRELGAARREHHRRHLDLAGNRREALGAAEGSGT
jgi:hypothetical protein